MKKLLLLILLILFDRHVNGQDKALEPYVVPGNHSACEVNAAAFDNLANMLRSSEERLFIVARLGTGESSVELNRRRLYNVRTYFKEGWPNVESKRFVFAQGDRVEGEGRIEFYVGSQLFQISLVRRGKDICVDCCDYPDPRYYGAGKKDKPTRKGN
ncbi:MAG TPA: hypothetical protein VLB68_12030 [Pyrinomonadaceae bacterium]|nr:hypothetical protein [Pyrinomonadaceae bacterium]